MFVIASKNDMVVSEWFETAETEQEARMFLQQSAFSKLGLDIAHGGWQFDVLDQVPDGFFSSFSFYPGSSKY